MYTSCTVGFAVRLPINVANFSNWSIGCNTSAVSLTRIILLFPGTWCKFLEGAKAFLYFVIFLGGILVYIGILMFS